MICEVTMYQPVCDGCGKGYVNESLGYCALTDPDYAMMNCEEAGWQEIDGKLYCPECYEYDEETDDYKPKIKED